MTAEQLNFTEYPYKNIMYTEMNIKLNKWKTAYMYMSM